MATGNAIRIWYEHFVEIMANISSENAEYSSNYALNFFYRGNKYKSINNNKLQTSNSFFFLV